MTENPRMVLAADTWQWTDGRSAVLRAERVMAGQQGHKLTCTFEGCHMSFVRLSGLLVSSVTNINCIGLLTVERHSDMEGYDRILFEVAEREGQTGLHPCSSWLRSTGVVRGRGYKLPRPSSPEGGSQPHCAA